MKKEQALGLHNKDEVVLKDTKEVCTVVGDPKMEGSDVAINIISKREGYLRVTHKSIK